MHPFRFAVSLRVFSRSVDPAAEICARLELKPKWQHKIGEPRMNPKGIPLGGVYDSSYCSFNLTRLDDEDLHEMLDRVVDSLLQHKELFHQIRNNGGRSEFFIGWYSPGNTGDSFSYSLLSKLGDLQIDLAFDVYGKE